MGVAESKEPDEVVESLDEARATLAQLVDASRLPDVADPAPVDRFLISAYARAWSTERAG